MRHRRAPVPRSESNENRILLNAKHRLLFGGGAVVYALRLRGKDRFGVRFPCAKLGGKRAVRGDPDGAGVGNGFGTGIRFAEHKVKLFVAPHEIGGEPIPQPRRFLKYIGDHQSKRRLPNEERFAQSLGRFEKG